MACLRVGVKECQGELPGFHLPGRRARLQQRHNTTLRRGGRETSLATYYRVLRQTPAYLRATYRASFRDELSNPCFFNSVRTTLREIPSSSAVWTWFPPAVRNAS